MSLAASGAMICGRCGHTQTFGRTTLVVTRGAATIVFRQVPARICARCGDESVSPDMARAVDRVGEAAIARGVMYDVCDYGSD
jgi:YgiT-type zinc finger domain-containing protein